MDMLPVRIIKMPMVKSLIPDIFNRQNIHKYIDHAIVKSEKLPTRCFAFSLKSYEAIDLIGVGNASYLVIQNNKLFEIGDPLIVQTNDGRILIGFSSSLPNKKILLEDKKRSQKHLLSYSDLHFIGKVINAVTVLDK
jgi:hypothetical protein